MLNVYGIIIIFALKYRKVVLGNLMHLDLTYWSFSLADIQSEMTGFV